METGKKAKEVCQCIFQGLLSNTSFKHSHSGNLHTSLYYVSNTKQTEHYCFSDVINTNLYFKKQEKLNFYSISRTIQDLYQLKFEYICSVIKRVTAYSLILIANIFLLVHAVTPHHHHQSLVCYEQKHNLPDNVPQKNHHAEHEHQHDGNKDFTICILNQPVVVPESQDRLLKSWNSCSYNHHLDYYVTSNTGYIDSPHLSFVVTYFHFKSSFLESYTSSSVGLRAPPVV